MTEQTGQVEQAPAEGDLAQWRELAESQAKAAYELLSSFLDSQERYKVTDTRVVLGNLRAHLAAMPQPSVNQELLRHLTKIVARADGKDTVMADLREKVARALSDALGDVWLLQLRAAIQQAEAQR